MEDIEEQLKKAQDILKKYQQEHLIQFYNELTNDEKSRLLSQIFSIDFEKILQLYKESKFNSTQSTEEIEPLAYIEKSKLTSKDIDFYSDIGNTSIKNGELAVVTLAGGQGSRLGFKGPKGTFELDTNPKISLFEILCNYLKDSSQKFGVTIPWYIMTSTENYQATVDFFESKNYLDYGRNNIRFFTQDNLPIIDKNGKLVLEEIYKIKEASNGNGNIFHSLKKHHILNDMASKNIKWIFIGGVDNVLLNPLDPLFIGLTIRSGNCISSKTLFKSNPDSLDWIFARKNSKPAIVDCENFVSELSKVQDKDGNYLYRETNMLAHLFSLDSLNYMADITIPYHRAFRKSPFVNDEGMKQVPDSPNVYKFEQFVFDAFSHFDGITLLRVNEFEEFAPIKSFTGSYNPERAKYLYEKNILHIENSKDTKICN